MIPLREAASLLPCFPYCAALPVPYEPEAYAPVFLSGNRGGWLIVGTVWNNQDSSLLFFQVSIKIHNQFIDNLCRVLRHIIKVDMGCPINHI